MDQPKMERLLRLMKYLSGSVNYTIDQLGSRLEMSPRTIYRYIDTFKAAGFAVTKLYGDIYKLGKLPRNTVDIDKLIYFSDEEACLVNSLIDSLAPTNTLKANLKQKLSAIYNSTSIADYVADSGNAAHVEALGEAINEKRAAVLRNYGSSNSNTIRNRRIEPFGFTTDYAEVWGYDLEDGKCKTFKISRIGEVELTSEPWAFEKRHARTGRDIFRMSGTDPVHIRLQLSLKAKNLLVEEYPLASKCLTGDADRWILDTDVFQMQGVGRFVAGLMGDVTVLEGEELRNYLAGYGKQYFN